MTVPYIGLYHLPGQQATTKYRLINANKCATMKKTNREGIGMGEVNTPIDVISVCEASGAIKPLRFRMEDAEHKLCRIDIDQVISTRKIQYVGIEAHIFLCRAVVEGQEWLFELKYTIRTHCWTLFRRIV